MLDWTAEKKSRKEIIKTLWMKNLLFISKPPDKNNIKMSVQKLSQEEELEITFSWLTEELKTKKTKQKKNVQNNNIMLVNKCLWRIIFYAGQYS